MCPASRQPVKISLACSRAEPEDDERGRWRRGIAAQPFGVGGADRLGKAVGAAENIDGSVLAVVAGGDAKMRLLLGRKRIANLRDGADQLIPADLFAQIVVVAEGKLRERPARCEWEGRRRRCSAETHAKAAK